MKRKIERLNLNTILTIRKTQVLRIVIYENYMFSPYSCTAVQIAVTREITIVHKLLYKSKYSSTDRTPIKLQKAMAPDPSIDFFPDMPILYLPNILPISAAAASPGAHAKKHATTSPLFPKYPQRTVAVTIYAMEYAVKLYANSPLLLATTASLIPGILDSSIRHGVITTQAQAAIRTDRLQSSRA